MTVRQMIWRLLQLYPKFRLWYYKTLMVEAEYPGSTPLSVTQHRQWWEEWPDDRRQL